MADAVSGQFALPPVVRAEPTARPRLGAQFPGKGFDAELARATGSRELRFSAHAQQRLASRNIQLDEASLARLAEATDRAEVKGARDSLFLLDDLGLIVNVPSRTVVTALDEARLNDGIFTNIDSTVIIRDR